MARGEHLLNQAPFILPTSLNATSLILTQPPTTFLTKPPSSCPPPSSSAPPTFSTYIRKDQKVAGLLTDFEFQHGPGDHPTPNARTID